MASPNATVEIYLPWYVLPSIRFMALMCALGFPAPTSDAVAAWIVRQVRTKVAA